MKIGWDPPALVIWRKGIEFYLLYNVSGFSQWVAITTRSCEEAGLPAVAEGRLSFPFTSYQPCPLPHPTSFTTTCPWHVLTLSSLPIWLSKKWYRIALKGYLCKTSTFLNCGCVISSENFLFKLVRDVPTSPWLRIIGLAISAYWFSSKEENSWLYLHI